MLAMFWVSLVWISNGNILSRFCSVEAGANVWPGKELLPV